MDTTEPTREDRLARITEVTDAIQEAKARLDGLYEERGDSFLELAEADPDCPVKAMADAAGGITGPAVSQQIDKARARRAAAEAKAAETGDPEPEAAPA